MASKNDAQADILERLFEVVVARRDERPAGSYVVSLLDGGWDAIAAKISEEAGEVVDAGRDESDEALAHEVADLLFHVWVGLAARNIEPAAVFNELGRRFGIGGHEEKASRSATNDSTHNTHNTHNAQNAHNKINTDNPASKDPER